MIYKQEVSQHEENLYIEGDNLDVLKLLQESYLGKVKMIYIDPPYNTGNDFIYKDNFVISDEEYSEESGWVDEEGDRLFRNTDRNGRFHSDWCCMMYSRLVLACTLLEPEGAIFISVDDHEVDNLKKYVMKYLEQITMLQLFHGENAPQNQMYLLEFLKIMSGLYIMIRASKGLNPFIV